MGSRYLFIVLYVFLEHHLSRGDYRAPGYIGPRRPGQLEGVLHGTSNGRRRPAAEPERAK